MMLRKFGCKPPETRAGQPTMAVMRSFMARRAPSSLIRAHIDPGVLMLGNDTTNDCTSAGIGNHIRATAALNRFQVDVTTAQALTFYGRHTGFVPGNPATDTGAVEVDMLTAAARDGYDVTNQTLFPIWGSTDPHDRNGLCNIMADLTAPYFGVQFADADLYEDEAGQLPPVWDTRTPARYGDPTPNPRKGHCLLGWSYTGMADDDLVELLTWGGQQRATWRWLRSRVVEAHALAWRQLLAADSPLPLWEEWLNLVAANDNYLRAAVA
ncbi:hypothetical protein LDL36_20185 [Komagataeibacter sp. FNDCR1]|nr:hypothetical protein [Komagataeibacter sp. FNDCR1]